MSEKKFTKEYLINTLIDLAQRKHSNHISKNDVDLDNLCPGSATYKRYFGNWSIALREAGLETGIITGRPQDEPIILSEKAIEVLSGEILGDGHLSSTGSNSCFQHSTANFEYGKYLYDKLNTYGAPLLSHKILKPRGSKNEQFHTRTSCNSTFSVLRRKWYENGIKIVPLDLQLTSEICLHWFLGDGSLERTGAILISTCNFSIKDVDLLVEKLNNIGFMATKNKDGKYYIVRIWKHNVLDFLNYIGQCPVMSYGYKWGIGKWKNYQHA